MKRITIGSFVALISFVIIMLLCTSAEGEIPVPTPEQQGIFNSVIVPLIMNEWEHERAIDDDWFLIQDIKNINLSRVDSSGNGRELYVVYLIIEVIYFQHNIEVEAAMLREDIVFYLLNSKFVEYKQFGLSRVETLGSDTPKRLL